jgi:hypothetical protein
MSVSLSFRKIPNTENEPVETLVLNYQCELCSLFIRTTTLNGEDIWRHPETKKPVMVVIADSIFRT